MTDSDPTSERPPSGAETARAGEGRSRLPLGVLLTVAYDGSSFSGFARQPTARTIAGELDGAVRAVVPGASLVRGASRTDAGVHALGQRVAFDVAQALPARGWVHALNAQLPKEIVVVRAASVPPGYEPRFRALEKTYRYVLLESSVPDPFLAGRAWRIGDRLNHEAMRAAAAPLVGEHDFAAFRGAADERENTVRKIFRIEVRSARGDGPPTTAIEVCGNGFLYRMVRIIVGSLVDIGCGRLEPDAVVRALSDRDRTSLGRTAPPDGLCLDRIVLDDEGTDAWPDPGTPRGI
ncbi:MAG TPA: tRNA pseudouridine(38-40) synthase TruA [Polyangiaceae bacterium]